MNYKLFCFFVNPLNPDSGETVEAPSGVSVRYLDNSYSYPAVLEGSSLQREIDSGRFTMKVVPSPGFESTSIEPL